MIIEGLINDRKRFNIQNCAYRRPIAHRTDDGLWELTEPSVYRWTWDLGDCAFLHPEGYRWCASVPRIARMLVDPEMLFECSLPHDMGYETQGGIRQFSTYSIDGSCQKSSLVNWYSGEPLALSRSRIDALFFAFALESKVPPGMAEKAYVAVYMDGQDAWDDNC